MTTTAAAGISPIPDLKTASPSESLLDAALASEAVGVFFLDRAARILKIGAGLSRLLGYEAEELVGREVFSLLHPEEHNSGQLNLMALAGGGENRSIERRYIRKDGEVIWVLVSIARFCELGEIGEACYVAQVTPIGKQKEAEAKIEEALERWTFALEGAGQGLWDFDLENEKWFFSPAWRRMRGIPEDEFVSGAPGDWIDTVHPDDRKRVMDIGARQDAGLLEEFAYEYRERHRDGRWIWIMARGRCIGWRPDGRPRRIIGTDTDITALKQREFDLAYITERLNLALTTSRVGVWITDRLTRQTAWDERTCEIFGHPPLPAPVPDGIWLKALHPADRDRVLELTSRCFDEAVEYSCDYRIITPTQQLRYVRARGRIAIDSEGREKMIGIIFDVTADFERAEALEHAHKLAERRNRELEVARAEMEHASLHDALTGLPNRRYLDRLFEAYAAEEGPACKNMTVLHLDLDRFKEINDTRGHAAGDHLLQHMAEMLRAIVGPRNTVARIGGDEFVVILRPAPKAARLKAIADEIIERTNVPIYWHGQECRTSTSIGVAESDGETSARQLLINADLALYRAKNLGRNRAAHFTAHMRAEIIARKQWGDDILRGLVEGEFIPYYQPQFDAQTLDIVGVEALVRWRHPTRGLVTPDRFLAVAEEINAIPRIDSAILEAALGDLTAWDRAGIHIPKVSVNVSARRLADEALIEAIARRDWPHGRISFELLESIFLDEEDREYGPAIDALKRHGVDIEIDDFGTGHASIVSLIKLNPSRLKIDRQLIAPIVESEQQRRLVRSIIEIGRSQGIAVCAEGVETRAHADILRGLGCDSLQGFHFSRPMPMNEMTAFVRAERWR